MRVRQELRDLREEREESLTALELERQQLQRELARARGNHRTQTGDVPVAGQPATRSLRSSTSPPDGPANSRVLEEPLLKLKLNHARAACPELLASAKADKWTHEEFLRRFLNEEMMGVDEARHAARVRAARFARTPSRSPPGNRNNHPSTPTSKRR